MRKLAACLIPLLLVVTTSLAGCTSLEDYLDKQGVLLLYIATEPGDLDDFQRVDLEIESFQVREMAIEARLPERIMVGTKVDIANLHGNFLVAEAKLPIGVYNLSAITVKVTKAVLKNGTEVNVALPPHPATGVYTDPRDLAQVTIERAKESPVRLGFSVWLNTPTMPGPDGEYFLAWHRTLSGPFTP